MEGVPSQPILALALWHPLSRGAWSSLPDKSRIYDGFSKTTACLQFLGFANASLETLHRLCDEIGFQVVSGTYLHSHRGKSDPGDALPIAESDEWHVMAWVLRKAAG